MTGLLDLKSSKCHSYFGKYLVCIPRPWVSLSKQLHFRSSQEQKMVGFGAPHVRTLRKKRVYLYPSSRLWNAPSPEIRKPAGDSISVSHQASCTVLRRIEKHCPILSYPALYRIMNPIVLSQHHCRYPILPPILSRTSLRGRRQLFVATTIMGNGIAVSSPQCISVSYPVLHQQQQHMSNIPYSTIPYRVCLFLNPSMYPTLSPTPSRRPAPAPCSNHDHRKRQPVRHFDQSYPFLSYRILPLYHFLYPLFYNVSVLYPTRHSINKK